jgi:hypothetical protein
MSEYPQDPPTSSSGPDWNTLKDHLEQEWADYLTNLGQNTNQARLELREFLNSVQPQVEEAIATGDQRSLGYLNARIKGAILGSGMTVLEQNALPLMSIIHAVISTLIAFV